MANIPQYIASRRGGYKKIPIFFRVLIQTVSFLIAAAGFVLALTPPPFFDLGILLLLTALSVLSFQFDWAHKLLTYIDAKLKDKAFRKKLFPILFGVFMVLLAGIFFLHVRV